MFIAAIIVIALALIGLSLFFLLKGTNPLPEATTILQNDGYTGTTLFPQVPNAILADVGAGNVASWAIGTKGSNLEMVVVAKTTVDGAHVQSLLGDSITATASGNVLRVVGPQTAFEGSAW